MGYSKAKWPYFGTEFKSAKIVEKSTLETHQTCSMQRSGSKKRLIFEKLQDFEKWQQWPYCMWAIVRQKGLFWEGI